MFYYRNGCHLCEEMAAVMFRDWPEQAAAMEWRDVDSDVRWRAAFGDQVPVLQLDGRTICALRPDRKRFAQHFSAHANPV